MTDVALGNRNSQPKMSGLLEFEQRRVATSWNQYSGVNEPIGDGAVKGCRDAKIAFQLLRCTQPIFGRPSSCLSAAHERLGCIPLLLRLHQFVTSNGSGSLRRFLQPGKGALDARGLGFRLVLIRFGLMECSLSGGGLRLHLGGGKFHENLSTSYLTAAVYKHPLDVTRDSRFDIGLQERCQLCGQSNRS